MGYEKWGPIIMIVISIFNALAYIPSKNYNQIIYWIAAAVITASVTFKIGG